MRSVGLLLLMVLPGCASWSGTNAARRAVYRETLDAQRFQAAPSEVAWRLRSQAGLFTDCARTEAGTLDCRACTTNGCSKLVDEGGGVTHIVPHEDLTEREVGTLWLPLDPDGYRRQLGSNLDVRVENKRIELERAFEPRWGFTGGVLAGAPFDGTSASIGARAGVRRWFDVHLLGHTALEYRWRGDHELHLRAGLEVSNWTDGRLWGGAGAPPASVSMFIGPLVRLPTMTPGIRTGVGVHITDIRSAPFFVEFSGDTLLLGEQTRVSLNVTIGIGL